MKQEYTAPTVSDLGDIASLTLGNNAQGNDQNGNGMTGMGMGSG